jgi:hypothetical protein
MKIMTILFNFFFSITSFNVMSSQVRTFTEPSSKLSLTYWVSALGDQLVATSEKLATTSDQFACHDQPISHE